MEAKIPPHFTHSTLKMEVEEKSDHFEGNEMNISPINEMKRRSSPDVVSHRELLSVVSHQSRPLTDRKACKTAGLLRFSSLNSCGSMLKSSDLNCFHLVRV